MISNKLVKDAKPSQIIVEFSLKENLPRAINQFYKVAQQEGISIRKAPIHPHLINIYTVILNKQAQNDQNNKKSKSTTTSLSELFKQLPMGQSFEICIVYLNEKQMEQMGIKISPDVNCLVIREAMDSIFSIDYQIEETLSENQTSVFLCNLSAMIINSAHIKNVEFYDQKLEGIPHNSQLHLLTNVWLNILYQIPGLGRQKCAAIVKQFPTYNSILQDQQGPKNLSKVQVGRGVKVANLGSILANRIYKAMTSLKGKENLIQK